MKRSIVRITVAAALACVAAGYAQSPKNQRTTAPQRPKETFWEWALRFSGISANPNTLKAAEDEVVSGQLWVADLASGTRRKITAEGGFRSPVYFPNGSDILAIQGGYVVRISSGGSLARLFSAVLTKLVGFSFDDPAEVLALTESETGRVSAVRLSLGTGVMTPLPYDPLSTRDHQMLEHMQGWERSYGDTAVYLKRESKLALSGPVEVFNVFLKTPGHDPQDISGCDVVSCVQPSLSPDGNRVLFIKAGLLKSLPAIGW
jgi:hypothetical protein